jgi:hypothetical protein
MELSTTLKRSSDNTSGDASSIYVPELTGLIFQGSGNLFSVTIIYSAALERRARKRVVIFFAVHENDHLVSFGPTLLGSLGC